jgi:uncharacterized membrane protein HdeD (DUF308 family)
MGPEIVFIFLIICATAMVFGIRYMVNKEKMALIERGMDPGIAKSRMPAPKPFLSLKFGLLLVGFGIGLLFALFTTVNLNLGEEENVAVYFGCLSIFGGIGLIVSYLIEKKWLDQQPQL